MKAQHKFLACLFSLLLLGSCTSDWLEPEQPSKLDPNNAYSTYTGCMGLVTKLCKDLRPEVMGRNTNIKWAYENSDLAVLVNGSPRDLDGMMVPSIGSKPKDLWDNTYKSITRAAMLVTRSESLKGSQEQKDEIRAYGEFFLGYWYYRLITTYGDVPLITEEIDYPKLDFRTSTQQRIINRMISMLEDAVKHLPETAPAGSVSRAAGYMILTKYYLMNGDFEDAVTSSTAVINTPGLKLMKSRFGALVGTANPKIPNPNVMTDLFYKYNPALSTNTEKILVVLDDPYMEGGSTTPGGGGGGERMREHLVEWYNGQYDEAQATQQRRTSGTGLRSTIDGASGGPGPFSISSEAGQDLQILWTGRGIGAQKKPGISRTRSGKAPISKTTCATTPPTGIRWRRWSTTSKPRSSTANPSFTRIAATRSAAGATSSTTRSSWTTKNGFRATTTCWADSMTGISTALPKPI